MGEYSIPFHSAMWSFPAAAGLALLPAFRRRKGYQEGGSSYADKAARKAKRRMQKLLKEKFQII